jgi:hypothetical protein
MVSEAFPAQPAELVREMVTVSHFDLSRVKELASAHPSLVMAGWDWGFGDWETPLGAASHMGNRPIAEYLISNGAPMTLFSAAMLGRLDVIQALIGAQPGIQRIRGPHSISLLAHARIGGDPARPIVEFLQSLKDADSEPPVVLKSADADALAGTYTFGSADIHQIDVNSDMKMYAGKMYAYPPQLNWTRKGTMTRPLFHLGDLKFYPAGAPAVRIRFTVEKNRVAMAISDGNFALSAVRQEGLLENETGFRPNILTPYFSFTSEP